MLSLIIMLQTGDRHVFHANQRRITCHGSAEVSCLISSTLESYILWQLMNKPGTVFFPLPEGWTHYMQFVRSIQVSLQDTRGKFLFG